MSNGFTGTILRVDLTSGRIEKQNPDADLYRTYMGGGALGTYFLLTETSADVAPLDARNVLTIAPGVTTGAPVSGASRVCVTAFSPRTGTLVSLCDLDQWQHAAKMAVCRSGGCSELLGGTRRFQ